jgi:Uma2 family endonuclease
MRTRDDRLSVRTLADLLDDLGDLGPDRVRLEPPPGRATVADLVHYAARKDALYELVDSTLVLKGYGWHEAGITSWLMCHLLDYLQTVEVGELVGPRCHFRLRPDLVRSPTIAFCTWDTLDGVDEEADIADFIPDLAVEMYYSMNTPKEMARKRKEYFKAGTSVVWQVYPKTKTVEVYTPPGRFRTLGIDDTLDGGTMMPDLRLPVRTLFSPPTKRGDRKRK